jgi:hypothetical protein
LLLFGRILTVGEDPSCGAVSMMDFLFSSGWGVIQGVGPFGTQSTTTGRLNLLIIIIILILITCMICESPLFVLSSSDCDCGLSLALSLDTVRFTTLRIYIDPVHPYP